MKHSTWMSVTAQIANDAKCVSLQVGCVLVKDGHVISTGVNGTPKGFHNCTDTHMERGAEHSAWSEKYEIHAEMNAIGHCPVSTQDSVAYVTHSPCFNCCKHMIAFGIKEIRFAERYYRMTDEQLQEIIAFCVHMNVELVHGDRYLTRGGFDGGYRITEEPGICGSDYFYGLADTRSSA